MAQCVDSGHLPATAPFDFRHSLDFLRQFTPLEGEQTLGEDSLVKALRVDGRTVGFRVRPVGDAGAPALAYELFADEKLDAGRRDLVLDRISFFLSLGDDLTPFYDLARGDPPFARIVESLYGYHQVKFASPFENAAWAILSQRSPLAMSRRAKAALVDRYGGAIEIEGRRHTAFPEAAELARVDLTAVIGNARRAEYLAAAAEAFSRVDESFLREGPPEAVEAWLRGIKGIGPWSAAFVLIRGLGRMERAPMESRLGEAAGLVYGGGRPLGESELARVAARYGRWQGYWAHYLRAGA